MLRMPCLLACALLSLPVSAWAMTAEEVVQKSGISAGFCSFPRAGGTDGPLALALAKRPAFVVHLLATQEKTSAALRGQAEAEGLLGRSLYVEEGPPAPLPFAGRMVDLLLVSDLQDADLKPELRTAWLAALAPRRGTALVGRAKAAGAGLSEEALKAWIKDLPLAKVVADESGLWALLKTDLPPGSDPWTHRCHGADNAQVSTDATFQAPFLAQWWALPRQEGFWGTTVVSGNGRLFTIRASRRGGESVFLTARSLNNGLVLWQKCLRQAPESAKTPHGGYVPSRACAVVAGETLCLIDRDGVTRLDAETGKERDRIPGPKPGGQIKWLAVSGNLLAMLAGEPDVMQVISYQTVAANPIGRELAVYDLETRKECWRDSLTGDVDERVPAIRDGRLYYLAQGVGVVARELATGKELWKNEDPALQQNFLTPEQKKIGGLLGSQPVTLALDEVLVLRTPWAKEVVALSNKDGALLWKRPSGLSYRALTALPVDGLWLTDKATLDLKTGKPAPGPRFISSGCGPTTAVPGYLITCFGSVSEMKTGKVLRPADLKSPCDVGSLVSEGVLVTVPSECACAFEVKCYRALAAAGGIDPHEAGPWKERLVEASHAEPPALPLSEADWPTYRHDPQRSGASGATLGDAAKVLWHWKPAGTVSYQETWNPASGPRLAPDFLATAPVTAGGNTYFASHDGVIRCLQADSGKELWKFPTAARHFAPPTLWEGRLLAGGGDGRVYCLDATSGSLLWKLLLAPRDRRLFWMGHLINTWPVTGGVVVKDGVGYAVAGYQAESGIHAYAFDPKTGKVLWERHDAGAGKGKAGPVMTSGGGVAIADDKLCLAGASSGSFDLKTGEWKVSGGAGFGAEIGVFCNRWVLRGGRRLTESESAFGSPINGGFPMDVPGLTSLPAWDAELLLFGPGGTGGSLLAVPADKYLAWKLAPKPPATPPPPKPADPNKPADPPTPADPAKPAQPAKDAGIPSGPPAPKPKPPTLNDFKLWASAPGNPAAFALAKDLAVAAFVDPKGGHKVVAFRRSDGTKAWSVDLPDQPAMNRLAVDRDGRVLLALCDGSILCLGR